MLLVLVAIWGTAFTFTGVAVQTLPAATLVAFRVGICALVLTPFVYATGRRLPRLGPHWLHFAGMALVGNVLPFFLISWGQERIDSGLAGILMAVMPIATLLLAHVWLHDERITPRRAVGFGLGFAGVVVLIGPQALLELGGSTSELARQSAVLAGALCYAVNSIMARRMPPTPPESAAAGVAIVGSLVMVPIALWLDPVFAPSRASLFSTLWLGLVGTALATVVFYRLIESAGPTFFSLINYQIPVVALLSGALVLGERPGWSSLLALALILGGVALGQSRQKMSRSE